MENEQKYTQNATEIDEAIDDLAEHGPPQHAWDQVAPGVAEQQAQAEHSVHLPNGLSSPTGRTQPSRQEMHLENVLKFETAMICACSISVVRLMEFDSRCTTFSRSAIFSIFVFSLGVKREYWSL